MNLPSGERTQLKLSSSLKRKQILSQKGAEIEKQEEQAERGKQGGVERRKQAESSMLSCGGRQQARRVEKSPRRMQNETVT